MGNFADLGVRKDFIKGLEELNIIEPSEIQEKVNSSELKLIVVKLNLKM